LPSNLKYTPAAITIDQGNPSQSGTPVIDGTQPISYSLSSNPETSDITIDNQGVISSISSLTAGSYMITVNASNAAGKISFENIYTIVVTPPPITFAQHIKPIIVSKCSSCHAAGLMTDYTEYSRAAAGINTILDRVQRPAGSPGSMPKSGTPLTPDQIDMLKKWLEQGLKE
jgi:hypothetical protein